MLIAQPLKAEEISTVQSESNISVEELDLAALELKLQVLQEDRADLAEQYQMLSGNRLLHRVLQEQRAALPKVELQNFQDQLSELRLEIFHLQRQLREVSTIEQIRLLVERKQQLQQQVTLLVNYTRVQQQLQEEVITFAAELEEYLFWTPSNPPLNARWWQNLPTDMQAQQQRMRSALSAMLVNADVKPSGLAILLLIALVAVLWQRPRLLVKLREQHAAVINNKVPSSPWVILQSLLKVAVYVLPVSLGLLLLGQFIGADEQVEHLHPSAVFTALAFAWFMVSFLSKLLQPGGFAESYFQWQPEQCKYLRRYIRFLAFALLPLTFVLAFASQQTSLFAEDVVGPLALLGGGIYITAITLWLFNKIPELYESKFIHRFIACLVLILPLSLIWMVSTGYYYAALRLSGYYLATFYVMSIWVICEASIRSGIALSTLQLKKTRDQELLELVESNALVAEDIENTTPTQALPQDYADIEKAEEQSLRLSRFFLMLVFGFILFAVWSEAFHAFDYLNQQYVWDSEQGINFIPISIGGLLSAIFILVFSVILIRNLPGLLEVLVLSRLKLQMGTAYAITSLTNYVLVSIAVITVLGILGVKWEQLQWLAAGLTVGLGFGLQEIFGNFISGLILFFERPVRVGDIVTLNNLSGRVTKIKIRATVITDFDRRDIVVPNRSFITGQFVNWSLSNTITRITVKVGVAYGSDLAKTREILLDIAEQEPRALAEPAPQVLFLSFGESTLDHELRVHVGGLADRNPAIDAMNREIDRRFKEAGIEIAFNQIDVHFRNELGVEKAVQTVNPEDNSPAKKA
ncbi:MAG: mechanosensitive ion channel [Idiomarina sp.]|nr:mechanosensitive ion channel [Idiomarina sp.]